MALRLESKRQIVSEVSEVAARAQAVIAADYHGTGVVRMTELRKQAREQGVHLRVVKNTLARRALADTPFACITDRLTGPMLFAFSLEDPASAARLVKEFRRENEQFEIKLVALKNEPLDVSDVERLASLPTHDQAIALLMTVMKAPIEKLARTLSAPTTKLVRIFAALRDRKQESV